jgi:hypothetical protein
MKSSNFTHLTNSLNLSSSWKSTSRSATQEFHTIWWNPKGHYHVYVNQPLSAVSLSQMNPVHTVASCLFKILPNGLISSEFSSKTLSVFPHATCPVTLSALISDYIWTSVQVTKLLIISISNAWFHFIPVGSKCPQHTSRWHLQCSSLLLRNQVSCPYNTTGEIQFCVF